MRILLVYAGKHGTTESCVKRLERELSGGNTIDTVDLVKGTVSPLDYDIVVFGASVYFGKLVPAARSYLKNYADALMQKTLGLFLVCGLTNEYEYYRDKLLPRELRDHAFLTVYFGGSLSMQGLSFAERLLVKSMRSAIFEADMDNGEYTPTLPSVLPENIDRMATYVRREIERLADSKT